jgi:hypothetical protein
VGVTAFSAAASSVVVAGATTMTAAVGGMAGTASMGATAGETEVAAATAEGSAAGYLQPSLNGDDPRGLQPHQEVSVLELALEESQHAPVLVRDPLSGEREIHVGSDVPHGSESICPAAARLEVTPPDEFDQRVVAVGVWNLAPCGGGEIDVTPIRAAGGGNA